MNARDVVHRLPAAISDSVAATPREAHLTDAWPIPGCITLAAIPEARGDA
jgi:predicted butyrate kinase (DUF1464 family)